MNFSVKPDITRLVKAGLVDEDWKDNVLEDASGRSVPFGSVVSLVTREGNPKNLKAWDDLLSSDVEVISPNPASSGSAKWNLLAPYSAWFFRSIEQQQSRGEVMYTQAHEYASGKLSDLVSTTFQVRPKSGREATSTFEQGQGDVLLSYENEAILLDRTSDGIDYLNPPETFRIENPVAVVNTSKSPQQAEAFRDYLFSKDAEKIWAQEGFRTATDLFSIDGGANMYLATVIDCYSRRLIGFAIADHMRTSLVQDALTAAKGQRGSLKWGSISLGSRPCLYLASIPADMHATWGETVDGSNWNQRR